MDVALIFNEPETNRQFVSVAKYFVALRRISYPSSSRWFFARREAFSVRRRSASFSGGSALSMAFRTEVFNTPCEIRDPELLVSRKGRRRARAGRLRCLKLISSGVAWWCLLA